MKNRSVLVLSNHPSRGCNFSLDDDPIISENCAATAGNNLTMHNINTLTTNGDLTGAINEPRHGIQVFYGDSWREVLL